MLQILKNGFIKGDILTFLLKEQVERKLRLIPGYKNDTKKKNGIPLLVAYNSAYETLNCYIYTKR